MSALLQFDSGPVAATPLKSAYSELTIAWEKTGKGPPTRIGRNVVYRLEAIESWLRQQEIGSKPTRPDRKARA